MTTFACFACGSPAFTIDGVLTDKTEVICADCGVPLGSWAAMREQLQARLGTREPRTQITLDDHQPSPRPIFARR